MNARIVEFWEKCAGGAAVAAAFALPLALHAEAYDPAFIKELLLLAAAGFTAGFTALRALEAGRVEIPANRAWAAAAVLVCAGGAAALQHSTLGSALILAPALLFLVVMTGPASISFMSSVTDSALAAGALASCWSLAQAAGYGAPLINPVEFGVLLGALFPLGLARGQHGAPAARFAARGAALLAALGVLVSGSAAGLLSLWIASLLFGLFGLAFARNPEARADAFAALLLLPATAWAAARSGMLDAWPSTLR